MPGIVTRVLTNMGILESHIAVDSDASYTPVYLSGQPFDRYSKPHKIFRYQGRVRHQKVRPVESTDEPNIPGAYPRGKLVSNSRSIGEIASVIQVGAGATGQTRSLQPQEAKKISRQRYHKQSHIRGPLSSNLPAVLTYTQKLQKSRPLSQLLRNVRRMTRRR